jgi:hypothetical protein
MSVMLQACNQGENVCTGLSKWMRPMSEVSKRGFADAERTPNSSLGSPLKSCRQRDLAAHDCSGCVTFHPTA